MTVTTCEGVIENGLVRLPPEVVLPERQSVLVLVPNVVPLTSTAKLPGVRLANAAKFEMKVTWGDDS